MTDWFSFACWSAWFLVAAATASVATEWLIGWTSARGVIDRPNDRSSHTRATPRGGGISIVAVTAWAVILAAVLWPETRLPLVAFLMPALAIATVSWLDDLKPLRNRVRFGVHLAAAAAATAVLGPVRMADFGSLGTFDLGFAAWPLTLLWIVGMTNAFNFMDGIDGIAGITAAVAGVAIAAAAAYTGSEPVAAVSLAFAGASIGFLTCNWPPARIFMGDVGSQFLGFAFAGIGILLAREGGIADGAGAIDDIARGRQRPAGMGDDLLARIRRAHRAPGAAENLDAQLQLQLGDLTAQGRLADVAGARRMAKMRMVRNRDNILKITKVHRPPIDVSDQTRLRTH